MTPIGYLFNGRFYKTLDDMRGKTMSEDNQPLPLYSEDQLKAKHKEDVIEAYKQGCFKAITDLTLVNSGADSHAKQYYIDNHKNKE